MREKVELVRAAVETLPPTQRIVLGLRDVEGWTAQEVCQALKLTTGEIRAGPVRSTPDDCHGCTTYLKQFRQTIRLTGALRDEQIDPGAREELLAAFRDWSSS